MPPPLGKTPDEEDARTSRSSALDDSPATRNTLRFFRERRIVVHYVDLRKKPIAAGELRRFTDRLGAAALLDTESRAYREQGLAYLSTDDVGHHRAACSPTRASSGCRSSATATRSPRARPRPPGRPGSRSPGEPAPRAGPQATAASGP